MKKFIALIIIIFLTTNQAFAQTGELGDDFFCNSKLTDVEDNSINCYYVNFLYYNNVVSGYSDETYRENNTVTRAEFSKYIAKAFNLTQDMSHLDDDELFPDVDEDNIFFNYIYSLRENDVVSGFTDGSFRPDELVTRGQVAKFLSNSIEKSSSIDLEASVEYSFEDLPEGHAFKPFILELYSLSDGEDTFDQVINTTRPQYNSDNFITRKELAKMVSNAMYLSGIPRISKLPKLSTVSNKIIRNDIRHDNNITMAKYDDLGITVFKTTEEFDFDYKQTNIKSIEEVAVENDYKVAINGSYFGAFQRQRPLSEVLDPEKDYIIVEGTNSYLRVRSEPDPDDDGNIIGQLNDGNIAEKIDENDEWFQIIYEDQEGWISREFSRDVDLENDMESYWEYLHAGFLNYYGEHLFPIKIPEEDSQVTHVVRYDTETKNVDIFNVLNFNPIAAGDDRYLEFQTGPLLFENSRIQNEFIDNSNNGNIRRQRNILVVGEDKKTKYFVIAKDNYKYYELLHVVLNMDILSDNNVDIISLDGGSSIGIYSENEPDYSFMPGKMLPIIIGLK